MRHPYATSSNEATGVGKALDLDCLVVLTQKVALKKPVGSRFGSFTKRPLALFDDQSERLLDNCGFIDEVRIISSHISPHKSHMDS